MSSEEGRERKKLAFALRLAEAFGLHEGICNHFSVCLESPKQHMLINPYGVHWSEITPESLLLVDREGDIVSGDGILEDSAKYIHLYGHKANPRHKAIFHTHMSYATAVTMIEDGELFMAHQTAMRYYGRLGYHRTFSGLAFDAAEGKTLNESNKQDKDIDILFLANHGVVVGGRSVGRAFDDLYYLERACKQQILAQSTGKPLKIVPEDVVVSTSKQFAEVLAEAGEAHFASLIRVLENNPTHDFKI